MLAALLIGGMVGRAQAGGASSTGNLLHKAAAAPRLLPAQASMYLRLYPLSPATRTRTASPINSFEIGLTSAPDFQGDRGQAGGGRRVEAIAGGHAVAAGSLRRSQLHHRRNAVPADRFEPRGADNHHAVSSWTRLCFRRRDAERCSRRLGRFGSDQYPMLPGDATGPLEMPEMLSPFCGTTAAGTTPFLSSCMPGTRQDFADSTQLPLSAQRANRAAMTSGTKGSQTTQHHRRTRSPARAHTLQSEFPAGPVHASPGYAGETEALRFRSLSQSQHGHGYAARWLGQRALARRPIGPDYVVGPGTVSPSICGAESRRPSCGPSIAMAA